jgi:hypothetical protein
MAGATIDHVIAITIFVAAILIFMNVFSQPIQTAIAYQQHKATATKCSDLLDGMLLNPGTPSNWGQGSFPLLGFGVQDPEFSQYQLSSFSNMLLRSNLGNSFYFEKTGYTYSNTTLSFGNSLMIPYKSVVNYTDALKLMGINGTYGFELTLTPVLGISIMEIETNPLKLKISVNGTGFPLLGAAVNYCLIPALLNETYPEFVKAAGQTGLVYADTEGFATVPFSIVKDENLTYAVVVSANLGGLVGVGCFQSGTSQDPYILPVVDNTSTGRVLLAHSGDVNQPGVPQVELNYNVTFVSMAQDYSLNVNPWANETGSKGTVCVGLGNPCGELDMPSEKTGVLVVAYKSSNGGGVVMMPWGISSLAFPVVFGGDSSQQEWVATDIRQVTIDRVAYLAKLAVWSSKGG